MVPRIKDQPDIAEFLREQVPEVSFVIANGQMPPGELDDIMNNFYDGKFDVLLSTTIVEIRPRHPQRQYADRPSGRPFRPGAALPDPRPHRPGQAARLCAVHRAAGPQADRHGGAPAECAAIARKPRRRLPAGEPRPRHPRRGQSARRGAIGPHQRSRVSNSTRRCWRRRSQRSRTARPTTRTRTSGARRSRSACR